MAELMTSRNWLMQSVFLTLCMLVIFFHLLPLTTLPARWPAPDLLICLVFAWGMRRPDYVPVLLVAGVMLMADLLFHRPPGLLAMLVVLGSEYLRRQTAGLRDASFVGEWLSVALAIAAITVLNRLILTLMGVDQAALGPILIQMLMSIAAYPGVVLFSHFLLGVRKLSPSETDAQGGLR
ncbi:rod shape-determining protein MreD [Aliisedimentitalea scapharcae]|uniref:Rod shape-determining protein MreD n=1 Tax=Aliisedimentitalea scapharcae TaxID=1524259 RepID=A0ABZ2XR87_9RHOB|nr:rod shape-determining protein MreD [Rhodobacteraceae bacterium M382]